MFPSGVHAAGAQLPGTLFRGRARVRVLMGESESRRVDTSSCCGQERVDSEFHCEPFALGRSSMEVLYFLARCSDRIAIVCLVLFSVCSGLDVLQ